MNEDMTNTDTAHQEAAALPGYAEQDQDVANNDNNEQHEEYVQTDAGDERDGDGQQEEHEEARGPFSTMMLAQPPQQEDHMAVEQNGQLVPHHPPMLHFPPAPPPLPPAPQPAEVWVHEVDRVEPFLVHVTDAHILLVTFKDAIMQDSAIQDRTPRPDKNDMVFPVGAAGTTRRSSGRVFLDTLLAEGVGASEDTPLYFQFAGKSSRALGIEGGAKAQSSRGGEGTSGRAPPGKRARPSPSGRPISTALIATGGGAPEARGGDGGGGGNEMDTHGGVGGGPGAGALIEAPTGPVKRRQYPADGLQQAYNLVMTENVAVRQAARQFGVPAGTLRWRIQHACGGGRVRGGPKTVLSDEEEQALEKWINEMAQNAAPVTRKLVTMKVAELVQGRPTPFRNNVPGKHWWQAFMRRHPDIEVRQGPGAKKRKVDELDDTGVVLQGIGSGDDVRA